jgi:hypothetical protein
MQSSARLCRISPWEIPYIWEYVAADLESALVHNGGEMDMVDLWRALTMGANTLWVVWDDLEIKCCLTTYAHNYEKKRVLFVGLLAGRNVREFVKLEDQLVEYARQSGCHSIESFVIPKVAALFMRLLPEYKNTHLILEKKL